MGIKGRAVDAGFLADIGNGDGLWIVPGNDEIEIGFPDGIFAFLIPFIVLFCSCD